MSKRFFYVSLGVLGLAVATWGNAAQVTCYVTADNHYGLYVAGQSGENIRFYGRNEYGYEGDPGECNWSMAETLYVDLYPGEFVYIAAWNDEGAGSVAGDFIISGNGMYSTDQSWTVAATNWEGMGWYSDLPSTAEIGSTIGGIEAQDAWEPVVVLGQNGGMIPNISPGAGLMWIDSGPMVGVLILFRSDLGGAITSTQSVTWGKVKKLFR